MYIYLLIIIIGQTYGAGRRVKTEKKLLRRISFESGDSLTASSFRVCVAVFLLSPDLINKFFVIWLDIVYMLVLVD